MLYKFMTPCYSRISSFYGRPWIIETCPAWESMADDKYMTWKNSSAKMEKQDGFFQFFIG
jgi:hypothetical protein